MRRRIERLQPGVTNYRNGASGRGRKCGWRVGRRIEVVDNARVRQDATLLAVSSTKYNALDVLIIWPIPLLAVGTANIVNLPAVVMRPIWFSVESVNQKRHLRLQ